MNRHLLLAAAIALCATAGSALSTPGALFTVAPAELTVPQSALEVQLPDGTTHAFATTVEHPAPRLAGVRGRSADGSRLTLFLHGDRILSGDLRSGTGHFQLVERPGAYAWIRQQDNPAEMSLDEAFDLGKADVVIGKPGAGKAAARVAAPGPDGIYTVDLLVVHTPLFEQRYGGPAGVQAEAQRLVFVANDAFANTGIPVRYRALDIERYTGTTESAYGHRNMMILSRDPAIRAYRDRIGADLVVYLRTADGRVDFALATLFNGADRNVPPQDVNPDRDAFAVTVTGTSAAGRKPGDFIFSHELGHTLGGGHNYVAHRFDNVYWQPHAHGWSCGVAATGVRYASIMSYGELDVLSEYRVREARGDFFSSPVLLHEGMPCGMPANTTAPEALQADNADIITQAAPYVAAYRDARLP